MILIGLTGGIACGKSTVSKQLTEKHKLIVIDADSVVRDLQRPSMPCTRKIAKRWPECVNRETGEIDRPALGNIIFHDAKARRELSRIMNIPIFIFMMKKILLLWWKSLCNRLRGDRPLLVVIDVPLLYETNIYTWFIDKAVVVACNEEEQIARLGKRNGFTRNQAVQRIQAQMPIEEKCRRADYVIRNDGTLGELEKSVDDSVEWMRRQSGRRMTCVMLVVLLGGVACGAVVAFPFLLMRL
ncbi:putative dephospho-CoA kinase [Trypanosoma theileri]|uniref:Putative dephospho-CoA kinase n=1 Tax=Trypanosoma theileri TaxID=67003 RepID=A0A1X0NU59_9TRYP|nr:putative dephospho-CoA kinase [Trypanosoma theileri]ORC88023.1 putative dephospho-CoA kinase [Trypanosoma theileri]